MPLEFFLGLKGKPINIGNVCAALSRQYSENADAISSIGGEPSVYTSVAEVNARTAARHGVSRKPDYQESRKI